MLRKKITCPLTAALRKKIFQIWLILKQQVLNTAKLLVVRQLKVQELDTFKR